MQMLWLIRVFVVGTLHKTCFLMTGFKCIFIYFLLIYSRDSSESSSRQSGETEDRHRDMTLHKQVTLLLLYTLHFPGT